MAGPYTKAYSSIWSDRRLTSLPEPTQRLYWLMRTQPNLSWCGVIPFTPKRWATLSSTSTVKGLERALAELVVAGLVVHDDGTEDVLIRDFIAAEGVLKIPNVCKPVVRDYCAVLSARVRVAIAETFPDPLPKPLLKGFPEGFPEPFGEEIAEPRMNPSGKGPPNPSGNPSGKGSFGSHATHTHTAAAAGDPLTNNGSEPPPPEPASIPGPASVSTLDGVVELAMRRRHKYEAAAGKPDPEGWLDRARVGIRASLEPRWSRIVAEHPGWDDARVDEALRPDLPAPRPKTTLVAPLEPDPDCPYCEGDGIATENGREVACECRYREAVS